MISFKYNNKSTNDFNLFIVSFDSIDTIQSGLTKEVIKGESNNDRLIPNHLSSKFLGNIAFKRALIKQTEEAFTKSEIEIITSWLTSSKTPRELEVVYSENYNYENGEVVYYNGLFTDIEYKVAANGIVGIIFTFTNDSSFCYVIEHEDYIITKDTTLVFNCNSDCLEDYTYPLITLKYNDVTNNYSDITINDINYHCLSMIPYSIDNQTKIVRRNNKVINLEDIFKEDSDIGWIKLLSGVNNLPISASSYPINVSITTKTLKKLGELYEY